MKNFNINIKFGKMSMGRLLAAGGILWPGDKQERSKDYPPRPIFNNSV